MKQLNQYIGKRLRELREPRNLTQVDIANLIGISRASYVNIELGRQALSVKNMYKILCLYGISADKLLPPLKSVKMVTKSYVVRKVKKEYQPIKV